ncbi:MAG: hypothetical protein ABGY96_12215 [bacterium]|nr:hypothetical protein [Gammaproteobacteria bacterium]HIL98719.1 hypothetical protein [Pseudomonadales bacterium]
MSEAATTTTTEIQSTASGTAPKMSDWQRFRQAGKYHGIAALALITLWAAADTWFVTTDLLIANIVSIINALVAGSFLAVIFHEWGHFAGARISKSYSPMVREIKNQFLFGFNFEKNSRRQFISMSLGGPIGNWLLVFLVFLLVPLDNAGRVTLLAIVVARAISVCVFEIPVIMRTLQGGDPQTELNNQLNSGAGDRGQVFGYLTGAALWLVVI